MFKMTIIEKQMIVSENEKEKFTISPFASMVLYEKTLKDAYEIMESFFGVRLRMPNNDDEILAAEYERFGLHSDFDFYDGSIHAVRYLECCDNNGRCVRRDDLVDITIEEVE